METNSDPHSEFEDELDPEHPPEGAAQRTAGGTTQPSVERPHGTQKCRNL